MNSEAHGASQLDLCPLSLSDLLYLATHFVLPFTANIEVEALLVALNLTHKFELHLNFSFPHTISACVGNVSKLFPGILSLLPLVICCLFVLELYHKFPASQAGLLRLLFFCLSMHSCAWTSPSLKSIS